MDIKATPYSNLKIFHHAELLGAIRDGKRVAPVYIRIKPTNICNENCYYCHYKNAYLNLDDYHPHDYIPREKMLEIIEDMCVMGVKAVTFSGGGEPLVYPYIKEAMEKILAAGIDLSMITNGVLLEGEAAEMLARAKWVRMSIDSADGDMYAQIRGVKPETFTRLCDNIAAFAKIKQANCELGVNFVVTKYNHEQVYAMAKLMQSLGVNHIKYAALQSNATEKYHAPFKDQVMADIAKARELENEHFRIIDLYTSDWERVSRGIQIFDRAYEKCYIKELVCVIAANQKVYYCHDKAYLNNGLVGDLHERRFKDVWFSEEVTGKFRKFNAHQICREHCVYDDRNILLNQFFTMDKNHVNFL